MIGTGVSTCDSAYYKWNQWIFLKMFERGLAYKKASSQLVPFVSTDLS